MTKTRTNISIPDITLLVRLVQNLLPSGEHMLQSLVVNHAAGFIVAQGPRQDDLQH